MKKKKDKFQAIPKEGFMTIPNSLWQYKGNDELKFDVGMHFIYKENGNRLNSKNNLAIGDIYYTENQMLKDLESIGNKYGVSIGRTKLRNMLQEFEKIGLIVRVVRGQAGGNGTPSTYRIVEVYNQYSEEKYNINVPKNVPTNVPTDVPTKVSISNDCNIPNVPTDVPTDVHPKTDFKTDFKIGLVGNEIHPNIILIENELKDLNKFSDNMKKQCIKWDTNRLIDIIKSNRDIQFFKLLKDKYDSDIDFSNPVKETTKPKVEAKEPKTYKKKSKAKEDSYQTKFHNFDENYDKRDDGSTMSGDEVDEMIERMQKNKYNEPLKSQEEIDKILEENQVEFKIDNKTVENGNINTTDTVKRTNEALEPLEDITNVITFRMPNTPLKMETAKDFTGNESIGLVLNFEDIKSTWENDKKAIKEKLKLICEEN